MGIRKYKPTTPGRRGSSVADFVEITRSQPEKSLVRPDANKTQIKIAVEKVFGVKVSNVNTLNRQGKRKRTKAGFGQRASSKRAIVTLREGRIEIFGGPVA